MAEKEPPKVVFVVEGGVLQDVYSTAPLAAYLIDHDEEDEDGKPTAGYPVTVVSGEQLSEICTPD